MDKKTSPTSTPWKVQKARSLYPTADHWTIETEDGKRTPVSAILKEQDAAFIVRAVNAHEALIGTLRHLADWLFDANFPEKARWVDKAIKKAEEGKL